MDRQAQRDIRRKLNGLQFAPDCGSVIKNVARKSVYHRYFTGFPRQVLPNF